jgi:hypothetical protein
MDWRVEWTDAEVLCGEQKDLYPYQESDADLLVVQLIV